jgi:hypothetical protein
VTDVFSGSARGRLVVHGCSASCATSRARPTHLAGAAQDAAAPQGALDLRVPRRPDGPLGRAGLRPAGAGLDELVLPVPLLLRGVEATRALGAGSPARCAPATCSC